MTKRGEETLYLLAQQKTTKVGRREDLYGVII